MSGAPVSHGKTPHAASRGSLLIVLAVTSFAQVMVAFAFALPGVMAPVVTQALGVAPESVGLFALIVGVAATLTSPFQGVLIHHAGPFRMNQIGLLVVALSILFVVPGWMPLVLLGAVMLGAGQTASMPTGAQMLARVTPVARLNVVLSVRQAGLPVGAALCGIVMPALLAVTGWREALLMVGAAILLSILLDAPLRKLVEGDSHVRQPGGATSLIDLMKAMLASRPLMAISICSFGYSFAQNSIMVYLVSYLNLEIGYSLATAGAVMAVMFGMALWSRLLWGWVADRTGNPFVVLAGLGYASALLNVVIGLFNPQWPVWTVFLAAIFVGVTMTAWNGVYAGAIVRYSPEGQSGAMMGAANVSGYAGMLLGPAVCALAVNLSGTYASVFFIGCAVILPAAWQVGRTPKRMQTR